MSRWRVESDGMGGRVARRLRGVGLVALVSCGLLTLGPGADGSAFGVTRNQLRIERKVSKQLRPKMPDHLRRISQKISKGCPVNSLQPEEFDGEPVSVAVLLKQARKPAHQEFVRKLVRAVTDAVGGQALGQNLVKGKARCDQKVAGKYKGNVQKLRDTLREYIMPPTIEDTYLAAQKIKELESHADFEGMKIRQIKDTLAFPSPSGLSNIKLYIRVPGSRFEIEIQLGPEPLWVAAKVEHVLEYEPRRKLNDDSVAFEWSEERSRRFFAAGLTLMLNKAAPPTWVDWPAIKLPSQAGNIRSEIKGGVYEFLVNEQGEPLQATRMAGFLRHEAQNNTAALQNALSANFVKSAESIVTVREHTNIVREIQQTSDGDARRILDALRGVTLCDTLRQAYVGLAHLNRMQDCQFVGFNDEFADFRPPPLNEWRRYPEIVSHVRLTPQTPIAEIRVGLKQLDEVRRAFEPVVDAHLDRFVVDANSKPARNNKNHSKKGYVDPYLIRIRANQDNLIRATLGLLGY